MTENGKTKEMYFFILQFPDDYRLTAAISIIKWVTQRYGNSNQEDKSPSCKDLSSSKGQDADTPKTAASTHRNAKTPQNTVSRAKSTTGRAASRKNSSNVIPVKALMIALEACRDFLKNKEHTDVDEDLNKVCS